ncbi:MAG: phosphoribosylglycinamide formyltransferase [Paludibacteraceae bacterium]|nr:phosphoribosylglycinamide formyltransferase [Paludibacteraceae bacterium]MBP6284939.1 phosphoribosylglycinamide formyltransferase [Paludibacteraceae bacterium]
MIRVAIFASGSGSNAENIFSYFSANQEVCFPLIVSNKADAYVHERAKKMGIPSHYHTKKQFEDGTVLSLLLKEKIDFIVLAGFLLKISDDIIAHYPFKIVNIHPALLPKFGGKGMYGDNVHRAVVESKETQTGITIHYVNEQYDAGEVIFQTTCMVLPTDTPDDVASKVHALEYAYFPRVLKSIWF